MGVIRKSKHDNKGIACLGRHILSNLDKRLVKELEEKETDIVLDSRDQFNSLRKRGTHIVHSKTVLFVVVLLCILDCILVMGGLIIELDQMKGMGEKLAELQKKNEGNVNVSHQNNKHDDTHGDDASHHSISIQVAHAFHYFSIAILAILLLETIFKILCFGRKFLANKFEVFDAMIVTASFVVDLVFLEGTTNDSVINNAQVLSFMLPWRVIRVVNSMIVSLLCHEHIKLLTMFKAKQHVQRQVGDLSDDLGIIREQMAGIKNLALNEGVADWKISKVIGEIFMKTKRRKSNALSTMVAMTIGNAVSQNRQMVVKKFNKKVMNNNTTEGIDKNNDHDRNGVSSSSQSESLNRPLTMVSDGTNISSQEAIQHEKTLQDGLFNHMLQSETGDVFNHGVCGQINESFQTENIVDETCGHNTNKSQECISEIDDHHVGQIKLQGGNDCFDHDSKLFTKVVDKPVHENINSNIDDSQTSERELKEDTDTMDSSRNMGSD